MIDIVPPLYTRAKTKKTPPIFHANTGADVGTWSMSQEMACVIDPS